MQAYTEEALQTVLEKLPPVNKFYLGFSGGLDSCVLLHSLAKFFAKNSWLNKLVAVHINHGWHDEAKQWEITCEKTCAELGVEYKAIAIHAKSQKGKSLEAVARQARYQAFAELLTVNDCLLTAHHQDDQAETFLLQLIRGAGVKGLASMPFIAKFASGFHARPLLDFSRPSLMEYAAKNKLTWIDDVNNRNLAFDRNYLRHEVIPQLQNRWPAIQEVLSRTAGHCAEAQELLDQIAQQDFLACQNADLNTLSVLALKNLPLARLKNLLRFWIHANNFLLPAETHMQHIVHDIIFSANDKKAVVAWGGVEMRRFRDDLYLLAERKKWDATQIFQWDVSKALTVPSLGILKIKKQKGQGIAKKYLSQNVSVAFRNYGERCHPQGRQGSHPLKKLFQEWNIPPWNRDRIPLIYIDDQLAAVAGYCICAEFAVQDPKEEGVDFALVSSS